MLLDTAVLIDVEKKHTGATAWAASLTPSPVIPGYAGMEFLSGARNNHDRRMLERFLKQFQIVWPGDSPLKSMLREFTGYRLAGGLGLIDALIAATALERDDTLATFNAKHYAMVPGLKIVRPYAR